jgi:hypothetical protein
MTTKTTKRAQKADATIRAYRRLFSTEDGQLVLDDLMKANFIGRTVVGSDVQHTYFNEGARSVILRIIQTCEMDEKQLKILIDQMNKPEEDMFN